MGLGSEGDRSDLPQYEPPHRAVSQDNVERIREAFHRIPSESVRRSSSWLGLTSSAVHDVFAEKIETACLHEITREYRNSVNQFAFEITSCIEGEET
jgi:hypothetical protein